MYQGSFNGVSGNFREDSRKVQECLKKGYFKIVTWVFQGRLREKSVGFKVILKNFKGNLEVSKDISRKF